jgi:hypothetical protein
LSRRINRDTRRTEMISFEVAQLRCRAASGVAQQRDRQAVEIDVFGATVGDARAGARRR